MKILTCVRSLEPGALEVVLSDFAPHEARFGNGSSEMCLGEGKVVRLLIKQANSCVFLVCIE